MKQFLGILTHVHVNPYSVKFKSNTREKMSADENKVSTLI